jgi:hypothetical protein
MLPATVDTEGDFLIGTVGFFVNTGGGVEVFLPSSRFSRLFLISDGVLLASVFTSDFLGGFSITPSSDFVSSERRCAATLPKIPLLRSALTELFSFNESFDPKLFLRYDDDVVMVVFDDFREALDVFMIFVPIGGLTAIKLNFVKHFFVL